MKVKVSDIRAQYPMYDGLNDEQLLGGLYRKNYADRLSLQQFIDRIDFDTERARNDPTEGMTDTEKFRVGAAQGLVNLGRGIGQAVGKVSREDIAESRKTDAPLLKTGSGAVGSFTGAVLPMLATAAIPGINTVTGAAGVGALTGLLSPSVSTDETVRNTMLGGLAGGGSILAGRGVGAAYEAGKSLLQPLTKKGQEQIAANTLRSFSHDPKAIASLKGAGELVPGSRPTMAQASGDPGLAQLERTLANNPETGPELAARYAEQRAARQAAVSGVAGTDEYYNAIKSGRALFANEDYSKAMAAGIDQTKAKAIMPKIESLLKRPSIQDAKAEAQRLAAESDIKLSSLGAVEGLDWLKKGLDSIISGAKKGGSSIGDEKLRAMVQTKQDLMNVLEEIAPAYKAANDNFAAMSRQVNSMDVARDLMKKYEPALARQGANTRETANAYAGALESAGESVKKSTGMDRPLSSVMEARDVTLLNNVAKDMARKAAAEDLGRGVGSNTAQNLAGQNMLRRTLGPTGLPQSFTESKLLQNLSAALMSPYKLTGADKQIMDRLAQIALDPKEAARLLAVEQQMNRMMQLQYLPALSGGLIPQAHQ